MFALPFSIAVIVRVVFALTILATLYWVVDSIGDAREAKVRAEYDQAIVKLNDQIDLQLSAHEKIAALADSARQQALIKAKLLPANALVCPANKAQAQALNEIR